MSKVKKENKALHIVGYIFGGFFVLAGILSLPSFRDGVISILFGLSLFHNVVTKIKESKFVNENPFFKNNWKTIRIIVSVLLFFIWSDLFTFEDNMSNSSINDNMSNSSMSDDNLNSDLNEDTQKEDNAINIESLNVSTSRSRIPVGDTEKVIIDVVPNVASTNVFKYTSSNPDVATIDSTGNIHAIKSGETIISIDAGNGKISSLKLEVYDIEVSSISFSKTVNNMMVGDVFSLGVEIKPSNATNKKITYESSNSDIISVSSTGKITALKNGSATITAKSSNGKVVKQTITVKGNSKYKHIGDTVKCDSYEITVHDFIIKKKGTMIDSYFKISDPEWIGVIVMVKNISDYETIYETSNIELQNSNGEIINHSIFTYNIWGKNILNLDSPKLIPGGTKKGYVQFANTNTDNSNLLLRVSCDDAILFEDTKFTYELIK